MPLSEQEQRLLEEMERSLYQNDADFVATASGRRGRTNYTLVVVGVLVGVLGFAIMFAGVLLAIAPPRRSGSATAAPAQPRGRGRSSASSSSFMDSLNERWDRRQDGRD